jgi:hypothetical protein
MPPNSFLNLLIKYDIKLRRLEMRHAFTDSKYSAISQSQPRSPPALTTGPQPQALSNGTTPGTFRHSTISLVPWANGYIDTVATMGGVVGSYEPPDVHQRYFSRVRLGAVWELAQMQQCGVLAGLGRARRASLLIIFSSRKSSRRACAKCQNTIVSASLSTCHVSLDFSLPLNLNSRLSPDFGCGPENLPAGLRNFFLYAPSTS